MSVPFAASHFRLKHAAERWERVGAAALRRDVFCAEQGLFPGDDADALDAAAVHLVALSTVAGFADEVVGTVRIHQAEPGSWWGSRLAVARPYRGVGALGAALIRLAVGTATARGCTGFRAHVQAQNELMFRHLSWRRLRALDLLGRPHVLMEADLAAYPPLADAAGGFHALARPSARRAA